MKKGFGTLIVGISVFAIGGFLVPLLLVLPLFLDSANAKQFIVPGAASFEVEEPGRYYLWNDYQTIHEGISYSKPETLPDGLEIVIYNKAGELLFFQTDTNITYTSGNESKSSIAHLELSGPDTLSVSITGDFEPRVFSFGEAFFAKFFFRILFAGALAAIFSIVGIALAVWGMIRIGTGPNTHKDALVE